MNINVILGTISFLVWSTFSTWYYVNYIGPAENPPVVIVTNNEVEETVVETEEEDVQPATSDFVIEPVVAKTKKTALSEISISKNFTFHKNSDEMINEREFQAFAESLKEMIADRKVSIEVVGRTCDLGSVLHNEKLGLDRAESAAQSLLAIGLDSDIETSSKGELDPIAPNNSEENRTQNRSVTIIINSIA